MEETMEKKTEAVKPAKRVYFALYRQYGFDVPARDPNGNLVPLKDGQGNQKYVGGVPQHQEIHCQFQVYIDSPTKGYVSIYPCKGRETATGDFVPDNPDEYAALEKMADDSAIKVMREKEYDHSVNPTAAALKVELEKRDKEIESMKSKVSEAEDWRKQAEELEAMLAEHTKSTARTDVKGK
jgi:hypothetical protein